MALDHDLLHDFAHALIDAEHTLVPIKPLTDRAPDLTDDDAYHIAADVLAHELEHGHRVVGRKVGFTNRDIQQRLGVDSPNFGTLLDDMTVRNGGRVRASSMIQPKVEPEIAFRLKSPLSGPGVTLEDVLAATDYVFPAIEIVDSRFEEWRFRLPDATADNACACKVVIGSTRLARRRAQPCRGGGRGLPQRRGGGPGEVVRGARQPRERRRLVRQQTG